MRSFWLRHIPDIELPGQEPDESIENVVEIQREAQSVPANGEYRYQATVNPASILFRESVFVLCKAVRISCEAAKQAVDGLPTWSLSTAHHSSMFALRAFLGLCGIAYIELENQCFLVDVRPSQRKGNRQKRVTHRDDSNEVQLIRITQMGHREWWSVYQRILRTFRGIKWHFPVDDRLTQCKPRVFSRHRNELHYRLKWFYEDLLEEKVIPSFGLFSNEAAEEVVRTLSNHNGSDGPLILNQVLLGNSLFMVRDLSLSSQRLKPIVATIESTVANFTNDLVECWHAHLS